MPIVSTDVASRLLIDLSVPLLRRGLRLRSLTDSYLPCLRDIYVATRWSEGPQLSSVCDQAGWRSLLEMQFAFQHRHYSTHYPDAIFSVLEHYSGEIAGRLYFHQKASELHIIDIMLKPGYRNQGIGRAVIALELFRLSATNT